MNRKDFIKGSCGVCIAVSSGFLMSALLESCKTPLGVIKTAEQDGQITIPVSEFATSDYKLVRLRNYDYDLAVQKNKDGSFEALVLVCTHAGQPLTKTGNSYYCTLHGSTFDHEGHVTKGPANKDMIKLNTHVKNDQILIQLKQI